MMTNNYEISGLIGSFPSSPIEYCEGYVSNKYDFEFESKEEINFLRANPEITSFFFFTYKTRLEEMKKINNFNPHDLYSVDMLSLTLVHYNIDPIISNKQIVEKIENVLPYTNEFEEIISLIISHFLTSLEYSDFCKSDERKTKTKNAAFAFIYLLNIVQTKELNSNRTISIDRINHNTNIVDLMLNDWDTPSCSEFLKDLPNEQKIKLIDLSNIKKELLKIFEEVTSKEIETAIKTNDEWKKYIDIINNLSLEETNTLSFINGDYSKKEKLNTINSYLEKYDDIEKGYYYLNAEKVNMIELVEAVNDRMLNSPEFCKAVFDKNSVKYIHPLLINYVLGFSKTFNYCLICYHRFRIEQNRETALCFFKTALSIIENNVNANLTSVDSIEECIINFENIVNANISNDFDDTDELKLENVQQDISIPNYIAYDLLKSDFENEELKKEIEQTINRIKDNYYIDNTFASKSQNQINNEMELYNEQLLKSERKFKLKQIICSVNIIYIFWNSLNVILNSKHTIVKNIDENELKRIRNSLYSIDCNLISKIYGDNVDKLYNHREEKTIDAESIIVKENDYEIDSSNRLSTILIDTIDHISKTIESKNVNQLFEKVALLREHVRIYPQSIDDITIKKIDACIKKICDCLVKLCKEKDDFNLYYRKVVNRIGNNSSLLEEKTSCIDTLATAEMLFTRYSDDGYDKFDYSCISSLYYQTFEEAYNKFIWSGYSEKLNNLKINGVEFSYWLYSYRKSKFDINELKGYLPNNQVDRKRFTYVDKKNERIYAEKTCMYKNFSFLIKQIKASGELIGFYDYFSQIIGKSNKEDMFSDDCFMNKLSSFSKLLEDNVDNRNNASHGGTKITKNQCVMDRNVVYANEGDTSLIGWLVDNLKVY